MPDASEAQAAYTAHASTIEAVAAEVRTAVHALPQTQVVQCEDASVVARADDAQRSAEFEACSTRRHAWLEETYAAWQALRHSLPIRLLSAHHDVVGFAVTVSARRESSRYRASIGATGPSHLGVTATQGFAPAGDDEGRKVGYHLYQTSIEFPREDGSRVRAGDGEPLPGIEVIWTFSDGDATAEVVVVVLIDDETTAPWRRAQRELLSGRR